VPFISHPTPRYDDSGQLIGAVDMMVDIADRKHAEEYRQQLALIVEWSDDAIVSKDLNGVITSWNRGAERLFGFAAEEAIGKSVTILFPPDRQNEELEILERIRRGERVDRYESVRRRKDGTLVEISLTVSPIKTFDGRIIGASKIARDITERKRAQEQQELLVNEVKHRIKNTSATVQAIAAQTFCSALSSEHQAFSARLQAFAGAQDLLVNGKWNRAPLSDIVDRALGAFQEQHRDRFRIDGPDGIWLDAQQSTLLTIALHELATNAMKYGALSNKTGQVLVAWELIGTDVQPNRLQLCWQESGGPPVKPPEQKGFGSQLIERALILGQGRGSLDFDPRGLACTLELDLPSL